MIIEEINDEFWGQIIKDSCDFYLCNKSIAGLDIEIVFIPDEGDIMELIENSKDMIQYYLGNEKKYKLFAAENLGHFVTESWNQGELLTHQQFVDKMQIESITIGFDSFDLAYDDGGIFNGHLIMVFVDGERNPTGADIAG
ncbi:DUF2262 domain-containing protein [Paenibacillus harenae]|uniref:DUF2262 domain-containing protein n=1 Tax=Paenibacillus harenae TaxID=306543 RepID=UPI0027904F25|nr:DUF2262 domain-containing protein [Paenibacillus harenae]MDQ0060193.1 hypothetical protein [Paenibacillus harenae]